MITSRFGLKLRKHPRLIMLDIKSSPTYIYTGDLLIVETNRGEEIGVAVKLPKGCERHSQEGINVHRILRVAEEQDIQQLNALQGEENELFQKANTYLSEQNINIKIISCELLFNRKKLILHYMLPAEDDNNKKKKPEKPNLKQLNRDLFNLFSMPLELRETGTRGEAKVLGGLGHCGQKLCCAAWLPKAKHITVKMAKEQSLAINIPKLSGLCNKLLCCLEYELSQYHNGQIPDIAAKKPVEDDNLQEYAKMFKEPNK